MAETKLESDYYYPDDLTTRATDNPIYSTDANQESSDDKIPDELDDVSNINIIKFVSFIAYMVKSDPEIAHDGSNQVAVDTRLDKVMESFAQICYFSMSMFIVATPTILGLRGTSMLYDRLNISLYVFHIYSALVVLLLNTLNNVQDLSNETTKEITKLILLDSIRI